MPLLGNIFLCVFVVFVGCLSRDAVAQEVVTAGTEASHASMADGNTKSLLILDQPQLTDPAIFLDARLTRLGTVSFENASLGEIADWVRQQTGVNVIVDERSLAGNRDLLEEPISDSISQAPVYFLLDRLKRLDISWRMNDGVVYLGGPSSESVDYTVQYNIGDLLDESYRSRDLLRTITDTIETDSWDSGGGNGSAIVLGDVLFVRQSSYVHRQVEGLLEALRHPARRVLVHTPKEHTSIQEALNRIISVRFQGESLAQSVQQLAREQSIDIRIDRIAFKDARISERVPLRIEIQDQPLHKVLDILTNRGDMAWLLADGVVWITSTPFAGSAHRIAVFDVRDLCRDMKECGSLENAITLQASPDSWWCSGGTGTISFPKAGIMVATNTQPRLDQVLKLLEDYRIALKNSKRRIAPETDPDAVETKYYRLPSEVAEDLSKALPGLVGETWGPDANQDQGSMRIVRSWEDFHTQEKGQPAARVVYSVLIIKQKRKVHEAISEILQKIQHGSQNSFLTSGVAGLGGSPSADGMGGIGGGMGGFGGGLF